MVLKSSFFNRPTTEVARDLIGCYLIRRRGAKIGRFMITETEAYDGPNDLACHASKGRTKRTEVLFGKPGRIYIYFTYGMHWLLNFVVGPEGYPAGVLIRAAIEIDPKTGELDAMIQGPARLTKKLGLDGSLHGLPAIKSTGLWLEQGNKINSRQIKRLPRVGVDYAGPIWAKKKWRFILQV